MNVVIENLKKDFDSKSILDIDYLNLEDSNIIGIIGRNGSGKTTLLKILAGIENSETGKITYDNKEFSSEIKKNITYVTQKPYMLDRSVYRNISYPLELRKFNNIKIKETVNKLIKDFNIESIAHKNARKISGGEKAKVSFLRGISFLPKLLLLDETTANIDSESLPVVYNVLKYLKKTYKTTIIIVSHNQEEIETICDKIYKIEKQKVKQIR